MMFASAIALATLAAVIAGLSFWGVISPEGLVSFVRTFMHRRGSLAFALAVRVLLAALLWLSALASHTPVAFRVLAAVALVDALLIGVAGPERISRLMAQIASWPRFSIRLLCLPGVAFGAFLMWSVWPIVALT